MEFRIVLHNFQQTKFADITFKEGLTIIKGTNNQGKSSLRRAIEAVVFNNPRKTKNYIMNGTKSCSVEIYITGYKSIKWTKSSKECTYTIGDSEPINKAGRLSLRDVYPDNPFTLFDDSLLFNVIKQGATPIPFGQSPSQVFSIFEELYGILSTKEDIGKFNNKISEYNTQIVQNTRQVDKLKSKIKVIKDYKSTVSTEKLMKLKEKLTSSSEFLNKVSTLKEYKELLSKHKTIDIPISTEELNSSIKFLSSIKKIRNLSEQIESRQLLEIPVVLDDNLKVYNKLQNVIKLSEELEELNNKRQKLKLKIEEIKKLIPVCPTCKRPL